MQKGVHTLKSEKENKTFSPEDSTVKLNTSSFLPGLENPLKKKPKQKTNKPKTQR